MKKIFSILIILAMFGCEVRSTIIPRSKISISPVVPTFCGYDPYPYPLEWASYCDSRCCRYDFADGPWICEEYWCYDFYTCRWEFASEYCY